MAAEEFEWNAENTTELITDSLKFPCLYDIRSKDCKNREERAVFLFYFSHSRVQIFRFFVDVS